MNYQDVKPKQHQNKNFMNNLSSRRATVLHHSLTHHYDDYRMTSLQHSQIIWLAGFFNKKIIIGLVMDLHP